MRGRAGDSAGGMSLGEGVGGPEDFNSSSLKGQTRDATEVVDRFVRSANRRPIKKA